MDGMTEEDDLMSALNQKEMDEWRERVDLNLSDPAYKEWSDKYDQQTVEERKWRRAK